MALVLDLPEHVAQQVEAYVTEGQFASPADVVEAAMSLLNDQIAHDKLRADIAAGLADVAAGRVGRIDFEAIKREGRAALAARQRP